ncbi:chitinase [Metarhizium rileyi]|uniref:Chitinase n=1 Tax=Metarhizium rileyi (strain RCEF 4871) TaxID=1649241 RepID=A0A167D0R2_METRR|nr:chitinase [Metarhizium rileyi RCEF 4871]
MKLLTLALASTVSGAATIFKGRGYGTYYYDIKKVQACGTDFSNQNKGYVECSFTQPLSLNQMNTNYVVAMSNTQLKGNLDKYCGKRVVVTVNGKKSPLPLFIGDGCERCAGGKPNGPWNPIGAPGLDFSYSVLSELSPQACFAGHIDLSWEIVDETLYHFNTTL